MGADLLHRWDDGPYPFAFWSFGATILLEIERASLGLAGAPSHWSALGQLATIAQIRQAPG